MKTPKAPLLYTCTIPAISVRFDGGGKTFAVGECIELDAEARPGLTWREALGRFADSFVPVFGDPKTSEE